MTRRRKLVTRRAMGVLMHPKRQPAPPMEFRHGEMRRVASGIYELRCWETREVIVVRRCEMVRRGRAVVEWRPDVPRCASHLGLSSADLAESTLRGAIEAVARIYDERGEWTA